MAARRRPQPDRVVAYFISAHGYGHATRAAAIMAAMQELAPATRFEIFTQVPRQLFADSLEGAFGYHHALPVDVGVTQKSSLSEDLADTLQRLDKFFPFDPAHIQKLARCVTQLNCSLVICDIAPLGIAIARAANIPSVLVENFTWDWIYAGYLRQEPGLKRHIAYLQGLFEAADYHIQTEPVCRRRPADLVIAWPISRKFKAPIWQTRQKLGLPDGAKAVLITLGGIGGQYPFLEQLRHHQDIYFIIAGVSDRLETDHNLLLLPHHSKFFHPDLINAADAVIGKVGYSTIAEVYQAGVPFGHIARPRFPESKRLETFIEAYLNGLPISQAQFEAGRWLSLLPRLLGMPRLNHNRPNGADQVARFILDKC